MRRALYACLVAGLILPLLARTAGAVDDAAGQERLGVRFGYVLTFDDLHDSHGDGWDMTLHFTERIRPPLFLEIRIGAIYLGELKYTELDDEITATFEIVSSMRMFYFSAGPIMGFRLGGATSIYGSAGVGVYSVSIALDSAFSAFNLSDQSLGFNGGLGIVRRLSDNWSLVANTSMHRFMVSSNEIYDLFTDGAGTPLMLSIAGGLVVDLR
jgi:opacity protein-like surface antigen